MNTDVYSSEIDVSKDYNSEKATSQDTAFAQITDDVKSQKLFWYSFSLLFVVSFASSLFYNDGIMDGIFKYAFRFTNLFELFIAFVPIYLSIMLVSNLFTYRKEDENAEFFPAYLELLKSLLPKNAFFFRILISFVTFSVFMGCFVYWKEKIGQFNAYDWDVTFKDWDAALFGGQQAWEFFHPYLGTPFITRQLDFLYFIWVPLCVLFWVLVYSSNKLSQEEKHQYICASLFSWVIIGIFAATYFASGGPVYYHHFTGDKEMYADLLAYLDGYTVVDEATGQILSSLRATGTFDYLWQVHIGALETPGGISAMPSMHNAQAILFALVTYKFSRIFGHLMVAFAIAIFIGSFHLAWHYAVDGIIALIMVLPIWFATGWLTGVYKKEKTTNLSAGA